MSLNKDLKEYIFHLDDVRQDNIAYAEIFNELFFSPSLGNSKEDLISELSNIIIFSENQKENIEILKREVLPMIYEGNINDYISDPYYKLISSLKVNDGRYKIIGNAIEKYQLFPLDDLSFDDINKEHSKIGYFNEDYSFPALMEGKNIWMSLNPNEINTMKDGIKKAKGNVLVLGLGLGYYPFMISNKDEVRSVTIIELEKDIINLFNKHLYPLFKNRNKIKVINDDGITFLRKNDLNQYDTIFIDIWHDVDDGLALFYELKKIEKNKNKEFTYWLHNGFIAMLKRCMVQALVDILLNEKYQKDGAFSDKIIDIYEKAIKEMNISTKEDINNLLLENTLIELLN